MEQLTKDCSCLAAAILDYLTGGYVCDYPKERIAGATTPGASASAASSFFIAHGKVLLKT